MTTPVYDNAAAGDHGDIGGDTRTVSYTAAGSNRFVACFWRTDRAIRSWVSATYAGHAMSNLFTPGSANTAGDMTLSGFYIAGDSNIPTGAQNLIVQGDAGMSGNSVNDAYEIASWNTVDSASPVSGIMTQFGPGGVTVMTTTVASAAGDLVGLLSFIGPGNLDNPVLTPFGTPNDTTLDFSFDLTSGNMQESFYVLQRAGQTLTTLGGNIDRATRAYYVAFSLKAAGGASPTLKTVNGLAKASIKTYDGTAAASIKSVDGLTLMAPRRRVYSLPPLRMAA